jgi:hypothetical protein
MWLSLEDARSDFVLTVAATVLGRFAVSLISSVPGYPAFGYPAILLTLVWQVVLTGLAAYLLARYRRDVPAAFGMAPGDRGPVLPGLVVAAPLLIASLIPDVFSGSLSAMLYGLFGRFTSGLPAVGVSLFDVDLLLRAVSVVIMAVGTWLFVSFITVRAREAFRSPDLDVTEALRTFGMIAVGASFVLGLLRSITQFELPNALLVSATLLIVLLATDQYVPARLTTTRATVLAPLIAVVVLHVLAAGGLFRGNLLVGLHEGAAAAVITICASALLEAKKGWAAAILLGASAVYAIPTLVQPLPCSMVLC